MTDDSLDGLNPEISKNLIAHLPLSMVIADPHRDDCPIVYVNRAFEETTGYSAMMAVGKNCRFLQGTDRDQEARTKLRDAVAKKQTLTVDLRNYRADGTPFINRLMVAPVRDDRDEVFAFVGVQTELSEEDAANMATADQANAMLQETQHRVKNHLSMVASMIRMQARAGDAVEAYDILARRVETLSLLYDEFSNHKAGRRGSYDVVSAGGYISRIAATIGALDGRQSLRLNVDTDPIHMRTDDAALMGLLASEILSNTLQHAFVDQKEGMVEVRLKSMGSDVARLTIADDGVGMGDVDWPKDGSLGARIVRGLLGQLGAEISVSSGRFGTTIAVDVPYSLATSLDEDGERRMVSDPADAPRADPAG